MKKVFIVILLLGIASGLSFWLLRNGAFNTLAPGIDSALPPGTPENTPIPIVKPDLINKAKKTLKENLTNPALISSLFNAAAAGDLYAVQDYIQSGVPFDDPGLDGMTPLLVASKNGNTNVAVSLLEAGANPAAQDSFKNSALHLVVMSDQIYTLDTLVKKGVPLSLRNQEEFSPLHTAAKFGATKSITYLYMLTYDFIGTAGKFGAPSPVHVAGYNRQWGATRTFIELGHQYRIRDAAAFGDLEAIKFLYARDPAQVNEFEPTTGTSALMRAVAGNYDEAVQFLLDKNADMYQDSSGLNSMAIAILKNFPNHVEKLLEHGYDINNPNLGYNKDAPLHFAIRNNKPEIIELLLEHNADINLLNQKGAAPLHVAIMEDQLALAKTLLQNGANINIKGKYCPQGDCDVSENTPLHYAVEKKDPKFLTLLIDEGADINAKRKNGETPLHLAIKSGFADHVKVLMDNHADYMAADQNGFTPLHTAVGAGNAEVVSLLLDAGADIEAQENEGKHPLHLAAELGNNGVVQLLIDAGADTNARDNLDQTPLFAALENAHAGTIPSLIAANANITVLNREQRSLLFPAVQSGLIEQVAYLLEKGLDINHADYMGNTPLHIAAQSSTEAMLKYLLEHGADPNAKDRFDQTALHFAADRGFTIFIRELLLAGAEVRAINRWGQLPIHRCALSGHWGGIHYFLIADSTLTINTPDAKGNTPLHMALQSGMPALVEILIERGADILSINERGFTPLSAVSQLRYATIHPHHDERVELKKREGYKIMTHFLRAALYDRIREAIMANDTESMRHFLAEEPSLLNVMVAGETPIHLAARLGKPDMVKLLLEFGANAKMKSRTLTPGTALELAQKAGHTQVVELLKNKG